MRRSIPNHERRSAPTAPRQRVVASSLARRVLRQGKRARGVETNERLPYAPPEDWYEPREEAGPGYRIVEQPAGIGYEHVVTPKEVRDRLEALPAKLIERLEVVQFSRMTRKKASFPCYGMQWGSTIYLYPIEIIDDAPQGCFVEYFTRPPRPAQCVEAQMYGGRWQVGSGLWKLIWTRRALKDLYLNNILIHELGHLLDTRNSNYHDRERFAEWFAIEHGYRSNGRKEFGRKATQRQSRRRHHSV